MKKNTLLSIFLIVYLPFSISAASKPEASQKEITLAAKTLNEESIVANIFKYINNKKWLEAEAIASKSKNSAILKITKAEKYKNPGKNAKLDFIEITKFLHSNPDWPGHNEMLINAENSISHSTDKKYIVNWFQKHPCTTSQGYKFYAYAAHSILKDESKLKSIIADAWVYGNFCEKEHKSFYKQFQRYLSNKDHVRKIDHLLINKKNCCCKKYIAPCAKTFS